ncbi:MAG: restriction endonuclease subunit S [Dysgonamonadaceae bacterium]|nr:restriction endonuclease subunit S [Dysgonamonadaceae bacterium]
MQSNYKPIGDYIQLIDNRNSDLAIKKLLGVSINKTFIPSVANVIGSDMANYKIIRKNQFACSLMQVRRDKKIPVALYSSEQPAIISQAYPVFEIIDSNTLLSEYLMMWFSRSEFDREACFYAVGGVRGSLEWDDFCKMQLPIPSLTKQQEAVDEYNIIQRRIDLNKQFCEKLEETAQTLYRKYFVDDIDEENLPEGSRWGKLGEYCLEIKSGGTPSRLKNEYWDKKDYRWLKTGEVQNNFVFDTEEYISKDGMVNSSAKIIPINAVVMAMYGATAAQVCFLKCETTTNQACCNMICKTKEDAAFLFFYLLFKQDEIKRMATGGAQENLSQELISDLPIIFSNNSKDEFLVIIEQLENFQKQNLKLKELQTLLLAKIGRKEGKV